MMSLGSSIQQLRLCEHQLFLTLTIVVGVLAGLSAVLFTVAIDWTTRLFFGLDPSTARLFVVPVDSPLFGADLFARLWDARGDSSIVVAHDGVRREPLFALYRRARIELPGDDADMPVWLWQDSHAPREVDFSDSPARFANLNTAEDFRDVC